MDLVILSALALGAAGHLVRRATPALVGLRDRRLPFSWPWLELTGAGLGALLGGNAETPEGPYWTLAALTVLLLAACSTDYLVQLIPDRITFGGAASGIALAYFFPQLVLAQPFHDVLLATWGFSPATGDAAGGAGALLAFAGALVGFAALELVRRLAGLAAGIEAMGMGDSKLLMLIGAFAGPIGVLVVLALSFLAGVIHGAAAAAITRKPHAPFGPALAAGAWLYLLGAGRLLRLWDLFQGWVLSVPFGVLIAGYAILLTGVLLLILRVRRRAAEYEAMIEADYREVDRRLEPDPEDENEGASHE